MKASPSVIKNIAANMSGRLATTLLAVLCTPIYISLLGIEAYGLIGFYVSLQATLSFLELGLSYTCSRQLARDSGQATDQSLRMGNTLRSLEVIYWLIAIFIVLILSSAANFIGHQWLASDTFSAEELTTIIGMMAWIIAVRWPVGLYLGALSGLQQQVAMNGWIVIVASLNWVGAVLVLWLWETSIQAFFLWQLCVAFIAVVGFLLLTWVKMPASFFQARYVWPLLKDLLPFTASVATNALLGVILLQADKLILSAIVPLKIFAYYALATMMTEAIILLANPVSNAISPRMAQMVGRHANTHELSTFFHLAAQSINVLIIPLGLMLVIFAHEVLYVYTGSIEIAQTTAWTLAIMAMAKILHANMLIPYALQLASGQLKLSLYTSLVAACVFVPTVYILSDLFLMIGAASAWLLITLGYVFIAMPLLLRQHFKQHAWWPWFKNNLLRPLVWITPFLLLCHWGLHHISLSRWPMGFFLLLLGCCTVIMMLVLLPAVRRKIQKRLG